jgi:hypothetical protein
MNREKSEIFKSLKAQTDAQIQDIHRCIDNGWSKEQTLDYIKQQLCQGYGITSEDLNQAKSNRVQQEPEEFWAGIGDCDLGAASDWYDQLQFCKKWRISPKLFYRIRRWWVQLCSPFWRIWEWRENKHWEEEMKKKTGRPN